MKAVCRGHKEERVSVSRQFVAGTKDDDEEESGGGGGNKEKEDR